MGTTAEKLQRLIDTKTDIKAVIEYKGVTVGDIPFSQYSTKIAAISSGSTTTVAWKPDASWPDLDAILKADTVTAVSAGTVLSKVAILLTDGVDSVFIPYLFKGYSASNGDVNLNANGNTITFTGTGDTTSTAGYKTRWIILYLTQDTTGSNNMFKSYFPSALYIIVDNLSFTSGALLFSGNSQLQYIKLTGTSNTTQISDFNNMFYSCYALQGIEGFDTSNGTIFTNAFYNCNNLRDISTLNVSKGVNFQQWLCYCYALTSIPAMPATGVTNLYRAFRNCSSLMAVSAMDVSSVSDYGNTFDSDTSLTYVNMTGISAAISLSGSNYLSHASLLNILNGLADLTGRTSLKCTLGTTNLAKLTDTEKAIATNKNWTLA